jgi:hypothetical protein
MALLEQLLSDLKAAFGQVERLPDAMLFAVRRDYLWCEGLHGGTGPWWEVPPHAIAHEPYALNELTDAGFQFFLPAYLAWVVQNLSSDYTTVDTTIYALDASHDGDQLIGERKARFDSLTSEQRAVVLKFLEWASTQGEKLDAGAASKALASYWRGTKGDA